MGRSFSTDIFGSPATPQCITSTELADIGGLVDTARNYEPVDAGLIPMPHSRSRCLLSLSRSHLRYTLTRLSSIPTGGTPKSIVSECLGRFGTEAIRGRSVCLGSCRDPWRRTTSRGPGRRNSSFIWRCIRMECQMTPGPPLFGRTGSWPHRAFIRLPRWRGAHWVMAGTVHLPKAHGRLRLAESVGTDWAHLCVWQTQVVLAVGGRRWNW